MRSRRAVDETRPAFRSEAVAPFAHRPAVDANGRSPSPPSCASSSSSPTPCSATDETGNHFCLDQHGYSNAKTLHRTGVERFTQRRSSRVRRCERIRSVWPFPSPMVFDFGYPFALHSPPSISIDARHPFRIELNITGTKGGGNRFPQLRREVGAKGTARLVEWAASGNGAVDRSPQSTPTMLLVTDLRSCTDLDHARSREVEGDRAERGRPTSRRHFGKSAGAPIGGRGPPARRADTATCLRQAP